MSEIFSSGTINHLKNSLKANNISLCIATIKTNNLISENKWNYLKKYYVGIHRLLVGNSTKCTLTMYEENQNYIVE